MQKPRAVAARGFHRAHFGLFAPGTDEHKPNKRRNFLYFVENPKYISN
jgi:hypothetical protein